MVKVEPLFRRRLTIDPHVKVAAEALVQRYKSTGRPEQVGKIVKPLFHNYLYGITRTALVERITHMVKREGKSLNDIWKSQKWISQKHKEDARSLARMGLNMDEWVVRFSEILMLDIKTVYEPSNNGAFIGLPIDLGLFYYVFGFDWKLLGSAVLAGVGFSEVSHFWKETCGLSVVNFTLYGVMLQQLYSRKKLVSVVGAILAALTLIPLYADPPGPGQWSTLEGAKHTDHGMHFAALVIGVILKWFR